jgi:hypothetical protein
MLLIDKVLLSPIYGTIWVARQVDNAIRQDREAEPERIRADLSELYMSLDTGRITEAEFTAREAELLNQLDRLEAQESGSSAADSGDDVQARLPQTPAPSPSHAPK